MLRSVWWVEATERCNLRCQFCYNPWRSGPSATHRGSRPELTSKLAAIATTFQNARITLSGGDVSTVERLEHIVAEIAPLAPLSLVSNGETLTRSVLGRLVASHVDHIQFSVHSRGRSSSADGGWGSAKDDWGHW